MSQPTPRWVIAVVTVCLVVLAADTDHLRGFPEWTWSGAYLATAGAAVVWRVTMSRFCLVVAAATMFAASFARASTFLVFDRTGAFAFPNGERAAGIALNTIIALSAMDFVASNWRWSR